MGSDVRVAYKPFAYYKKGSRVRVMVEEYDEVDVSVIPYWVLRGLEERGVFKEPVGGRRVVKGVSGELGVREPIKTLSLDAVDSLSVGDLSDVRSSIAKSDDVGVVVKDACSDMTSIVEALSVVEVKSDEEVVGQEVLDEVKVEDSMKRRKRRSRKAKADVGVDVVSVSGMEE